MIPGTQSRLIGILNYEFAELKQFSLCAYTQRELLAEICYDMVFLHALQAMF